MKPERMQSWIYKCLTAQDNQFPTQTLEKEDIEDLTNDFLWDLRAVFELFVKAFNDLKKAKDLSSSSFDFSLPETKERLNGAILLYDLADGKGFMLFRKGYKLIFSYVQPGCIRVQFLKQKPLGEMENFEDALIKAITNETMSINWVHENHKGFVNINVLARYYMRRFLQSAKN